MQNVNDVPVGVPVVSGIATQNQTLAANVAGIADADGLGAFTFQWSRGGTAIVGATNQTLVLTQADVGQTMAVRVNYTDLQGTPESLISASTTAVVNVNDPTVGSVTINNLTPDLLRTLTVSNNLTDPDGTLALVGYQWQSAPDGTNVWIDIVGATGNSFTTNTSGVQLRVAASYTVAGGPVEVMISSPVTAAVGVFHIILGTNAAGETLNGTAVADRMVALGGNDTMNGFDGNDILIGGAGTDTMAGGSGDDVYEVTEAGDMVIETLNQGNDSVRAYINYTLTDHVENLFLMGSAPNLTGTGNALDNVMSGNGGNNTLNGGSGTDAAVFSGVMTGYHLSYNLGVITVLDINAVDGSDGSDTLNGIEQLYFTGQSLAVGNFNALNYIASYSDLINAFGSNPDAGLAHYSSTGLDEGRSISFDPVTYLARYADLQTAFGTDVNAAARHFITNGFNEGRTSYVAGGITISGSPNADTLTGGTTSETLLGLDGDDTLTGGGGNDFLDGGAGNDIAVFKGVMKGYNGVVNDGNFTIVDKNLADGNDGNANFVGIEVLRFADRDLSLVGFNALDYVASYSDLISAFGANAGAGFGHYLSYGVLEGRTISFDPITYLAKYNDLRIAFGTDSAAAARHYITYGFNEGRTSNTSGNDLLTGSASADTLNGGAGNDTILGLAGNDTLTGGIGVDNLTGGTDADNFNYNSVNESGIGAGNRDIITDFLSGTDRIDLSGIDANASLAGNQAFTMINTLAFSGVAGQLRYSAVGTDTVMEGDVDGNGVADFEIQLTGIHTFVPADLVL